MKTTVSKKRTPTNTDGVFYKEIFNSDGKVVDKKFIIRWIDENGKDSWMYESDDILEYLHDRFAA